MYKGEGERLILEEGIVLYKGVKTKVRARTAKALQSVLFCFDAEGNIVNQEGGACNCALPPESKRPLESLAAESFGLIAPKAARTIVWSVKHLCAMKRRCKRSCAIIVIAYI